MTAPVDESSPAVAGTAGPASPMHAMLAINIFFIPHCSRSPPPGLCAGPPSTAYALQRTERAGVACDAGRPLKGNTMKIRPLHDRVIVKRLDEEKKTASGIVIP